MKNCKHGNFPITCAICHYEDEINTLRAELAALKKAAKALIADVDDYVHCSNIDESSDALAALVGEGGRWAR